MSSRTINRPLQPRYESQHPSQARLLERQGELRQRNQRALVRVDELVRSQQDLSRSLGSELKDMQAQGAQLDALEARDQDIGVLASLMRSFNRRKRLLERHSVAEDLLERYQGVSQSLARASAFSDELQLCALELQEGVQQLHEEIARAARDRRRGAQLVLDLDQAIQELESAGCGDVQEAAQLDQMQFEQRSATLRVELHQAQVELLGQELLPAKALRDTMLSLHEEMAAFVLRASSTVNSAGRRIQALGVAADAPAVVAELQQSLLELGTAMQATEQYVEQAQDLLVRVLPDLSAQLAGQGAVEDLALTSDLRQISRERARALADQALRRAAEDEVETCLDGR